MACRRHYFDLAAKWWFAQESAVRDGHALPIAPPPSPRRRVVSLFGPLPQGANRLTSSLLNTKRGSN
jgi:hypothetical protein